MMSYLQIIPLTSSLKDQIGRNGRGERIRTSDPLVPNQVRYQTALRPEYAAVRCRLMGGLREAVPTELV